MIVIPTERLSREWRNLLFPNEPQIPRLGLKSSLGMTA